MNYKDIFLLYLYVFIILGIYIFSVLMAYIGEINEKWDDYRCNPMIMPIAGYIKQGVPNPVEFTDNNFQDCASILMKPIAETGVNMPVKPVLGVFENVLGSLNDSVFSVFGVLVYRFRMMMMTVLQSLSNTFNTVSSSVQGTGFRIQYIMKRLGGVMTSIVYKLASLVKMQEASYTYSLNLTKIILGIGLGVGLFNTPIMIFTASMIALLKLDGIKFCFHPECDVELYNGEIIKAKNIRTGHRLKNGEYIITSFKLCSQGKKFVNLGNMIVTEDHKVIYGGKVIEAKYHPRAYRTNNIKNKSYVVCWNTSTGTFKQSGIIFQDYEGEKILENAEGLEQNITIPVWYDGFFSYKKMKDVKLGDTIGFNKTKVLGIVRTIVEPSRCIVFQNMDKKKGEILLGENTIMNMSRNEKYIIRSNYKEMDYVTLYTFITDKKGYVIKNNEFVYDYENTQILN
jgi:hypothetical protein